MRNLFDTLSNAVGQFTNQGNNNSGYNQNQGYNQNSGNRGGSALGQIGAMGVGGLLGALASNPKNISKTVKQAAMIGGGAALGGLAYSMYQKWRNQPAQGQQPYPYQGQPQGGYLPPQGGYAPQQQGGYGGGYAPQSAPGAYNGGFNPQNNGYGTQQFGQPVNTGGFNNQRIGYQQQGGTPFPQGKVPVGAGNDPFASYNTQQQQTGYTPEVNSDAISDLLLEAMVFAARADNHIDNSERQMILKMANELRPTQDLMNKIQEFLNEPLDPNVLARKMPTPDMAPDLYRLSAAAIVADTPAERQYLQDLARALRLPPNQVQILDQEAMQFRRQQGQ